jgi:hypothetical protein
MTKTITGTWSYPDATPAANAILNLQLSSDAVVTGTSQIASRIKTIQLNSYGQIPAGVIIWANDELSPDGTVYITSVIAPGGGLVYGPQELSLTGSSPININNAVPTTENVAFVAPVLLNPTATQEITGFDLIVDSNLSIKSSLTHKTTFVSTATADRTVTFPDNTGTVAELNLAQSFSGLQTFGSGITGTGDIGTLQLGATALGSTNSWPVPQTFLAVLSATANPATVGFLRLASADGVLWRNAANGANLTLAKTGLNTPETLTWNGLNIPCPPATFTPVNLTGQTATIGSTLLYATPSSGSGLYRISYYAYTTTAGTGGTLTLTLVWDDASSKTYTTAAVSLSAVDITSVLSGSALVYSSSSQNINYLTTVSGSTGSPQYALRIRLEYLG